jgi:hypothetical protein
MYSLTLARGGFRGTEQWAESGRPLVRRLPYQPQNVSSLSQHSCAEHYWTATWVLSVAVFTFDISFCVGRNYATAKAGICSVYWRKIFGRKWAWKRFWKLGHLFTLWYGLWNDFDMWRPHSRLSYPTSYSLFYQQMTPYRYPEQSLWGAVESQ